ncbi:MAG TPA: hypothetical protein D7H89_01390 [Candidatus Poseidoniales archaeon]|nr:MAG TPA: hypothetical protein D7H89_01390 [Candidatus Poseidoniales archaeon]HII86588.1 hypothetical protein [Candidatus Poseidoniaceae archaeon]
MVLGKTTTPLNLSSETNWSNIDIRSLEKQGFIAPDELIESLPSKQENSIGLLPGIDLIHSLMDIKVVDESKFFCLHDDHAYVLGADLFHCNPSKILTTIRSPLDMLASKKNMLLFHLYKTANPQEHIMTEEALEKELVRALFSWLVASYEYSRKKAYYPILFEHIKGKLRRQTMGRLCDHLDLTFDSCLECDVNELPENVTFNELLYAGSSLRALTKGKSSKTVGSSNFSLTKKEQEFIGDRLDLNEMNSILNSSLESFYLSFASFWENDSNYDLPVLRKWIDLYQAGKNSQLFEEYSSFNYGGSNAELAF